MSLTDRSSVRVDDEPEQTPVQPGHAPDKGRDRQWSLGRGERVSAAGLLRLGESLSAPRWTLLHSVAQLRLVTGGQLRRRHYGDGDAAARRARLDLAALHELNILHRLERRIGGARAGSTGFVYAVGAVGRRLLDFERGDGVEQGRSRYEPSIGFVDHALAVSELWVGLHEFAADPWTPQGEVEIDFRVEQAAWRSYPNSIGTLDTLKPDAEVRLRRKTFADSWFLEVDRATERASTIRRKLDTYVAYFYSGAEQREREVFPLTAWLTTTDARAEVLAELIAERPHRERRLFRVGLLSSGVPLLFQGPPT
jgi:hypothetical protein